MSPSARAHQGAMVADIFVKGAWLDARHAAFTRLDKIRGTGPWLGAPISTIDPFSGAALADPDQWFRSLHESAPVNYCPKRDIWIINGYHEVRAAARAHDVFSSADGTARFRARVPMLVALDRPPHARLRRILARDFTRDRMAQLEPMIRDLINTSIAEVLDVPMGTDLYGALAAPIPLEVIARILGIPDTNRSDLRRWSNVATAAFMAEAKPSGLVLLGRFVRDMTSMFEYFEAIIEQRRRRQGDDALSRLAAYEDEEGPLTTDELMWFTLLLLVAGNETTTSVKLALLLALGSDSEQYDLLRTNPSLIPQAVEEGLRWASPVPSFFRTARAPYEIGGVTIPADARVMLCFAAANRDPIRFSEPARFNVRREIQEHVAFGSGIHFCLGSHLARLELALLLEVLSERVQRLEIVGQPIWRENASLRGLEALPMRFLRRA